MNNYQWIFSGIGVLVLGYVINFLVKKKKSEGINNSITINNNVTSELTKEENSPETEERIKGKTKILFIDDNHTDFKIVSILKRMGWINTKSVKDIIDLDDPKVVEADIIFVDINGVGTTMFDDQGLGLASALKNRHKKKKIIIYSAETTGDRFHKALREVDDCLSKDAEPFQFSSLIEEFAKSL